VAGWGERRLRSPWREPWGAWHISSHSSVGCNRLIQDGAGLVVDVNDILSELNLPAARVIIR
jgi:hypothetical protein